MSTLFEGAAGTVMAEAGAASAKTSDTSSPMKPFTCDPGAGA
ncbi:hypothetical protein [Sphingobium ummariense]|nr:hypothetical protein [Sphingobium ummariense]